MRTAQAVCSCKVGTASRDWGLKGIHDDLAAGWREEGASIRELTDRFNCRLLRAGFRRADRTPIDGEIDNLYRVLTDDDVDAGSRTQARERLRRSGVPIEDVEAGFVSHQTIYRHLRNCLDIAYDLEGQTAADRVQTWRDRIRALRARTATVADRGVDSLSDSEAIDLGSFDVLVDVNVTCNDCGEFYDLDDLLDRGGCECGGGEPNGL